MQYGVSATPDYRKNYNRVGRIYRVVILKVPSFSVLLLMVLPQIFQNSALRAIFYKQKVKYIILFISITVVITLTPPF